MTTIISDKDGNLVDASSATIPSDRHFRNAWTLSGSTITEDLTAAKTLFKEKIREVRKPLLEAEDVVYMKALESSDSSAQSASVTKKNALRDAPAASAITNAANITALKNAWDTDVLGDSPYA
jgi:hypothetical protein|tara:strand:+ start:401 stop:769 length:369 start_codon:yes stop_codon:yes gene_type:complete